MRPTIPPRLAHCSTRPRRGYATITGSSNPIWPVPREHPGRFGTTRKLRALGRG